MPRSVPARPRTSWLFLGGALALGAVVVLCAMAAFGYVTASRWVDHTLSVQSEIDQWVSSLDRAHHAAVVYVTTGSEEALHLYDSSLAQSRREEARVEALVGDNTQQLQRVSRARFAASSVLGRLHAQVVQAQAGHRSEATRELSSGVDAELVSEFRQSARRIRTEEAQLLNERRAHADSRAWIVLIGAGVLAAVSLALLVFAWRREAAHEQHVSNMAREARQRLRILSELATALSSARAPDEVGEVVVQHGMQAAGGDTCSLYLLNSSKTELRLIAARGVSPELVDKLRRVSATEGFSGIFQAVEAGRSIWVQNEREYAATYPDLASLKVDGLRPKAFWSVPMIVEGSTLGLFGVGYYEPRNFSADERAFAETLVQQCAQALLRATRLQAEEAARRWFVTTLRSIGDAVIATDSDGRVMFVNPVAERLTGYAESEAVGKPLTEVFQILSELTRAPAEDPVAKVLREDRVIGLANHTLLRQRNGAEIPIDDSGAPIRDENGSVVGVVLVFRDVSEKKRAELQNEYLAKAGEALASSLDYRTTLATIAEFAVPKFADWCAVDLVEPGTGTPKQVAVAHVDPNKVAFARQLGERYPPDPNARNGVPEVVRTGESELYVDIPPEMLEAAAQDEEHRRVIRELKLRSAMVVPLRARGRTFGAMTFVYAESGRHYEREDLSFAEDLARRAAMAIENAMALRDADEARSLERWMRGEAERANRAKDEFLATVSHELRTPLNAILGWAVTLRSRKPPEDIDRALAVIERNARSQAKLIDDVLDVSRIISGKLSLTLTPTNVATALRKAVETVTPAAQAKNISVSVDVSDDNLSILADGERLQQVAWNLLSNAVKFTPKQGHVSVSLKSDGSEIVIRVTDDGEGIRSDVLPLVFEPFQQADASTTRRHGGLGLGLSIVKQLIVAHGGSVSVESDGPGRGATFTVRLPARQSSSAVADAEPSSQDGAAVKGQLDMLAGLRVLIVDDEPDALQLLRAVLTEAGAEVHAAGSASEALQRFLEVRPDVLVSDIGMPNEDGYSLIRKVRAQPVDRGGRTPAVALTAYARPQDVQRAFVAGFQMHVVKPVEPAALRSVVANLGGRSLETSSA
ncbi:MAG TPA: ATP-binding protein [Polyangiaceae bacterium]|nr:ATP-binding protein [Polyangiaceae bacterium]